jgi:hypothetical protein
MAKAGIKTFANFISFFFFLFLGDWRRHAKRSSRYFKTATTRMLLREKSIFNAFSDLNGLSAIFSRRR